MLLLFPANQVSIGEQYNGTTSDVNLGSPPHLDDIGAQTVIAVVKSFGSHGGGVGYIYQKCTSTATNGLRFMWNSTNSKLAIGSDSSGSALNPQASTSDGTLVSNEWYALAGTFDNTVNASAFNCYYAKLGNRLALDNYFTQAGSGSINSDASSNAHIGERDGGTVRGFNGLIAYVAVYKGVLSQTEIQRLVDQGHNTGDPRLMLLWSNGRDWSAYRAAYTSKTAVTQAGTPSAKLFNRLRVPSVGFAASNAQTLTPSLFTNTSTFHAATLTPGAVTLTPSLVTNSSTFPTHTLSQAGGAQTLTASLFTNSNTFHAATVTNVFEIDDNYERSSVNLSSSSISGTGDSAVITIKPRVQESEVVSSDTRWMEPSALVRGLNGYRPTFRFSSYEPQGNTASYNGYPWQAGRRPMFSYDRSTWTYFDTAVTVDTTNKYIEFRHSTAFTSNTVYISRSRQISVEQTGAWIDSLESSYPSIISPTTSASAFTPTLTSWSGQAFIADEFSSQTNELSATIPATPLYAFEINDTSVMPDNGAAKRLAVMTAGVHAGEDHGNYVMMEFIDRLLTTAEGETLRKNYRIQVYPMINAPGRAGGGWRGSFTQGTGGADDANRHFSDATPGLEIVTKPRTAMATDRGADVPHWFIDFHGTWNNTWALTLSAGEALHTAFNTLLGTNSGQSISDDGDPPAGSLATYYKNTVGSRFYIHSETGDPAQVTDANITTHADGLIASLNDLFQIVAPSAFTNSSTFHAPTIIAEQFLEPALVANDNTFHTATLSQANYPQTLTASLFENSNVFHLPTLSGGSRPAVGGNGGKRKGSPSRKVYIEEDGVIIVFDDNDQAQAYLAQVKPQSPKPKRAKRAKQAKLPIQHVALPASAVAIPVKAIRALAPQPADVSTVERLIRRADWAHLVALYERWIEDDDEDVLILAA